MAGVYFFIHAAVKTFRIRIATPWPRSIPVRPSGLIDDAYCRRERGGRVSGKMTRVSFGTRGAGRRKGFAYRGYVISINPRQSSFLFRLKKGRVLNFPGYSVVEGGGLLPLIGRMSLGLLLLRVGPCCRRPRLSSTEIRHSG